MAEEDNPVQTSGNGDNDSLDINELASLNEDYSVDFLEQLQNKLTESNGLNAAKNIDSNTDDTQLFEEVTTEPKQINENLDDNFMKKYKARLEKQQNQINEEPVISTTDETAKEEENVKISENETIQESVDDSAVENKPNAMNVDTDGNDISDYNEKNNNESDNTNIANSENKDIETISGGNILEKPLDKELHDYNQSLDYLDQNTKYSKYVIYIDPENKEFIDSLTVKERKNLINRVIREQDSVVVTKANLNKMQAIILHAIVAMLTVLIAIPVIYWVFNASLESTINNYNTSQSMFKALYKEHGKIQSNKVK